MTAFYNECDSFAAQWLRNLISAGHIAPGIVDERPIQEIEAFELFEFTQCHFFAGIGVWSHALRNAGWDDDRPIWTGSCPCQPFSNAGKKKGISDERHLWPFWQQLIAEQKPSVVIGEQVASTLDWLDIVQTDMETSNYAFGASDLCAAGFNGAHIRQRLYFVGLADDDDARSQRRKFGRDSPAEFPIGPTSMAGGMADTPSSRRQHESNAESSNLQQENPTTSECRVEFGKSSTGSCYSNAPLLERNAADWLFCRDGKWRPVEPSTFPLVDAAPARVGRLRAYGNALDAETATEFCRAVKEICDGI